MYQLTFVLGAFLVGGDDGRVDGDVGAASVLLFRIFSFLFSFAVAASGVFFLVLVLVRVSEFELGVVGLVV